MKKWVTGLIMICLAGVVIGFFIVHHGKAASIPNLDPSVHQDATPSSARNSFVVQAVKTVGPAVVGITNKAYMQDEFDQKVLVSKGVGSGVIFSANGYIATNYHVVEGAQNIVVSLNDGRKLPGKIVGTDPATDLAVVKVDADNLPAVTFGDSDSLMVGEPAIAIGNPLGLEFQGSVTVGVISALHRSIEIGDRKFKLIQTSAAINPGNSGGALVNADGQVIGINSAKISAAGVEGMGFAIPINSARPILQALVEKGKVVRSYLGVEILDNESAARFGYDLQVDHGVYVARTEKNGPAEQAGIEAGDIIIKVNGTAVNSVADVRAILDSIPVGQKVTIIIERNNQQLTMNPILTATPN